MTTNDVSYTRISDERLDIEEIVERVAWKLCALENEVWDETDDSFKARYRREAAQMLAPSRIAQALEPFLASRHPQPVNEPAEWQEISERIASELSAGKEGRTREWMYDIAKDAAELALRAASIPAPEHPDDLAVDRFAATMKAKLKWEREERGRSGWQNMTEADLSRLLMEHLPKGDPVDVANFCMMLSENGQRIQPAPERSKEETGPLAYFTNNVDAWGAAQWFDRLAKAIRDHDAAVVSGDEIKAETCRMIASSSAMRLVRDFEQVVRAALETPPLHKEGEGSDPTEEMIAAGLRVDFDNEDERATVINVWHAMSAAAPAPVPVTITDEDWLRRAAMDVMLATEVEEATRILKIALSALSAKPGEQG